MAIRHVRQREPQSRREEDEMMQMALALSAGAPGSESLSGGLSHMPQYGHSTPLDTTRPSKPTHRRSLSRSTTVPQSEAEADAMLAQALALSAAEAQSSTSQMQASPSANDSLHAYVPHVPLSNTSDGAGPSRPPTYMASVPHYPPTSFVPTLPQPPADPCYPQCTVSGGSSDIPRARSEDVSQDWQLAQELQMQEDAQAIESSHSPVKSGPPRPLARQSSNFLSRLKPGKGKFLLSALQRPTCAECHSSISGSHIQTPDGKRYHSECHTKKFAIMCSCCKERVPSEGTSTRFVVDHFWDEKYCLKHLTDGTLRCTACQRLRSSSDDLVPYEDGRFICLSCLETTIPVTANAETLFNDVLKFYESVSMKHPERPPMMLVDDAALNDYTRQEGGRADGPVTHTRGLCLCESYEIIQASTMMWRALSNSFRSHRQEVPIKKRVNSSVTAILVLNGLPQYQTGAILAHELMHAWLHMQSITELPLQVEEGLCQLMAYLWIESQNPKSHSDERMVSFIGHQIRTDRSEVYGDGFRMALSAIQMYGLPAVLSHVRKNKVLPA